MYLYKKMLILLDFIATCITRITLNNWLKIYYIIYYIYILHIYRIYFIYSIICKPYGIPVANMWSCFCLPSCHPWDCFRRGLSVCPGPDSMYSHQLEYMVRIYVITPKLTLTNGPGSTLLVPLCLDICCVSTAGYGSVQSAKVGYGSRFHCQKVGVTWTEPHCAVLSRSTPPLGYWDPERVPAISRATRAVRWLRVLPFSLHLLAGYTMGCYEITMLT